MLRFLCTSIICCLIAGCTAPQAAHRLPPAIHDIAARAYDGDGPGGAVVVVRGNEILTEGYGFADLESRARLTPDSALRIGSLTKSFTAIAVLRLVERGLIDLDKPIGDYLDDLPPQFAAPTVRQLLSHTSGLPEHFADPRIIASLRNPVTPAQTTSLISDLPPQFAPGTAWAYSNFNYLLLGRLIEQVSGETYEQFIQSEVFSPLGMTNSLVDDPARVIPGRARGYDTDGVQPVNSLPFHPSHSFAAGNLLTSARDLGLWGRALSSRTLLNNELINTALAPATLSDGSTTDYGLGFNVGTFAGERVVWHSGSTNGFNATYIYAPSHDVFVAVLSNGFYLPNTTTIARRILANLLGIEVPEFESRTPNADQLRGLQGRYTLADGRVLQFHVQDGVRYSLGAGWTELDFGGDGLFFVPDSLTHFRVARNAANLVVGVDYYSSTLARQIAAPLDDQINGAQVSAPVDTEQAAGIAGAYLLPSGDQVLVSWDSMQLSIQMPGQPPLRLVASAANSRLFFARSQPVQITLNEDRNVLMLTLYGSELEARRL